MVSILYGILGLGYGENYPLNAMTLISEHFEYF